MTTIGGSNIFNLAIEGSFDDCQKIVKDLFNENEFRTKINMSGVNSINWARIVCQIVYYFYSYFKLKRKVLVFLFQLEILVIFMLVMLPKKWDYQLKNL